MKDRNLAEQTCKTVHMSMHHGHWALTMMVVTTTVRFSRPVVSLGSSGESWISTSLSASFQ